MPGGQTKKPLVLYFRDALEVFRFIFGKPEFAGEMSFEPLTVYTNYEKIKRIYTHLYTANWAKRMQVSSLPAFIGRLSLPFN